MEKKQNQKEFNYKVGAIKRKLNNIKKSDFKPGDLITASNELSQKEKLAIMGLI